MDGRSRHTSRESTGQPPRHPLRPLTLAATLAALAAALATAAQAQLGLVGDQTAADTELTPVAKDPPEGMWTRVAGARHPTTAVLKDKVTDEPITPFELDLYDVSLVNVEEGFAAGAECNATRPAGKTPGQWTEDCERVPAIYRYTAPNGQADKWQEVYRDEHRGYVAQVAWIAPGKALAVGGDGCYPRREEPCPDGETPAGADPAGQARAWLYEQGEGWRELSGLPQGMGGLSALDCSPRPQDDGLCVAGGLRQLWYFRGGRFEAAASDESPEETLQGAADFRFRVRDVKFVPGKQTPAVQAVAVTSGCCAADLTQDVPRTLIWDGTKWYVRPQGAPQIQDASPPHSFLSRLDSYYSLVVTGSEMAVVLAPGGPAPSLDAEGEPASRVSGNGAIPTPGSPNSGAPTRYEPTNSQYYHRGVIPGSPKSVLGFHIPSIEPLDLPPASSLRLVSGDTLGGRVSFPWYASQSAKSVVHWAVGVLGSSGQGAAYTTTAQYGQTISAKGNSTAPYPYPFKCDVLYQFVSTSPRVLEPQCAPRDTDDYLSDFAAPLYKLPSYGLNSLDLDPDTGGGFAVGDHGAILRISGAGGLAEPGAPTLGERSLAPGSNREPYDPYRPPTAKDDVGLVPPLGERPLERLPWPQFVAGGSSGVGKVSSIVMSRDGREGWAFDPQAGEIRAIHYNGSSWSSCAPPATDPACAGAPGGVVAAARVPYENDPKATDPDRFEVVAVNVDVVQASRSYVYRYADGRWQPETATGAPSGGSAALWDVAFTAPDDGWIVGKGAGGTLSRRSAIWRFTNTPTGKAWVKCPAQSCDDPGNRLPLTTTEPPQTNSRGLRLAVTGERVYLYGTRVEPDPSGTAVPTNNWPLIVYHDRGGGWKGAKADGAYDPGGDSPPGAERGRVYAVSVAKRSDGRYEGWTVGDFGDTGVLRLEPGGVWRQWSGAGPGDPGNPRRLLSLARPGGGALSVSAGAPATGFNPEGPMLGFDAEHERWQQLPTPWLSGGSDSSNVHARGSVQALAPDGRGGFWAAVGQTDGTAFQPASTFFYHYTDEALRPVFEVVPHPPTPERITTMAGGGDGSVWIVTNSNVLYRYDRIAGWERLRIPGWDPGRVVTATSAVNALALGPEGRGVAVGPRGRIADLGPEGVRLNDAAGTLCDLAKGIAPPCGTGRDLSAAAVAPDGSALVTGSGPTLLWRPAGGGFRLIPKPPQVEIGAGIDGVTLPSPERAWLTAQGKVLAGRLSGDGEWHWTQEDTGGVGAVGQIAVDASGHGYSLAAAGKLLERTGDGEPWRAVRSPSPVSGPLAAAPSGTRGGGALAVGGDYGQVLTIAGDRAELARPGDPFDPLQGFNGAPGRVAGLALTPGLKPGQVEAWVALAPPGYLEHRLKKYSILHYASDPSEPLLDGGVGRAEPLPDTPAPRPGELAFAAFGKSECHLPKNRKCQPTNDANLASEAIARRVRDEIVARSKRPGGPVFALFTGDVNDAAGGGQGRVVSHSVNSPSAIDAPSDPSPNHGRWAKLVAERFDEAGVPLFGAIGRQDLSQAQACAPWPVNCSSTRAVDARRFSSSTEHLPALNLEPGGLNGPWREALASMPKPWGTAPEAKAGALSFVAVEDSAQTKLTDGERVKGLQGQAPAALLGGGARTHYALDVKRGNERLARLVFVDNSLRSLAAADPFQNPAEPGGQQLWLAQMLCFDGSPEDTNTRARDCTRRAGEPAVVVSNTPTYSYGPGALTDTATDATAFESLLMRYRASVVVSGRLGWNGLYWALAAGVHEPCPGGAYQQEPPGSAGPRCGQAQAGSPSAPAQGPPGTDGLANALRGLAPPAAPAIDQAAGGAGALDGLLPVVVSATAGGKLGPDGEAEGSASDGFWHGYAIVRVSADGDSRKTIVEQRPVFDWVGIRAQEHTLRPGQRMTLHGYGREPTGYDGTPTGASKAENLRYDEIDSPAITHRYDLVLADPEKPYLPFEDAAGDYVPLPAQVATVDSQTGKIKVGRGNHPRTFAIGMLSVGDKVATWPLAFEPRRSFRPKPAQLLPSLPLPKVAASAAAAIQSPQAPPPVNPPTPQVDIPPPPTIPPLPTPSANPPAPPAPPAPPPPPVSPQATPLDLVTSPVGLNVAPQATVIPPPAPPIQPAPPGGARREARQRQAATQKSGADVGSEAGMDARGDLAESPQSPTGAEMRRRERVKPGPSITALPSDHPARDPRHAFTAVTSHTTPTWRTTALYAGGLTGAALLLALGWSLARPRPRSRRRPPHLPAPAEVEVRRR